MKSEKFDVVILGGGNAGIGVTGPVRRAGMSVAMIESHDLGGTCPNRGCTPKKVLVAADHALHEIERASVHHIAVGKPKLDWAALIDRKKDLIKDIPANLARSMAHRNVEVIKGHAVFASPNTIRVGDRELDAKHISIPLTDGCLSELVRDADETVRRSGVENERSYAEQLRKELVVRASFIQRWTGSDENMTLQDEESLQALVRIARKYALPRRWKLSEPVVVEYRRMRPSDWHWTDDLDSDAVPQA